jgi:endo-alpha-1,4-polygalactosaminidase (GH114 family)
MYDIDMFDATASLITSLHAKGRVVICYFSTQYEDWRPDASSFTSAVLGNNLDDWPGERYVDIRSTVVRNIIAARLDLALSKGCDGVEPDNVDGYTNSNGFSLTSTDQINFNTFIATEAHKRGLSVGLKNDLDQVSSLVGSFDWALNEQCNEYSECSYLRPFVTAGKAVFGVEYTGSASSFCPSMVTSQFSWLLKDLDLDAQVTQCCTYATGGCAAQASYQCKTYNSARNIVEDEPSALQEQEGLIKDQSPPSPLLEEIHSSSSTIVPAFAFALAVAALVL